MAQKETNLGNQIRLWCGQHGYLCFRYNTGKVQDAKTGIYIDFGPPKGHSDYIVFANKRAFFVETKVGRNKQSTEQRLFAEAVRQNGFDYILAYSLDEFIQYIVCRV